MEVKVILLSCALLAICLTYLPTANAVACDADGLPDGCTDCTDAANVLSPDCVTPVETTLPSVTDLPGVDTTTAANPGTDTTTAAPSGKKTKTRRRRKFKIVRKGGKKIIKRRRRGGKKWGYKG